MTFSGVASNFAGVPLALAFIFTIGRTGLLDDVPRGARVQPLQSGFSLYSKIGLEIVYFYFQLPLMILIIAPAIDGLKQEWREASENMGATHLAVLALCRAPVLMPSLLGAMILLFGNAFGAQATAYQLTGGFINIVTILIGNQLTGDVLHNVGLGLRAGDGHGRDPRPDARSSLHVPPAPFRAVAAMTGERPASTAPARRSRRSRASALDSCRAKQRKSRWRFAWWAVFIVGIIYFVLPLLGTFAFSMRSIPLFSAYTDILSDTKFFTSLGYSFLVGAITIILSITLLVPTAFWVRLRMPRARPFVEFITLLPFVIPPIVLVFGLISTYSHPPLPFTHTDIGSTALLVCGYVVLSFPYMYRAIDTGMRSMDIQSLTEAAQSLGAGWIRIIVTVILPNLRVALLSGAFLTLAIVVGEFTMALFLARPAFGPYLSNLGSVGAVSAVGRGAHQLRADWIAMGFIALLGRGSRSRITVTGAR